MHIFGKRGLLGLGMALGIALLSSAPAMAQSNMPYQPGGSTGMSLGYRQGILNDKLLGSRPSALVRGPNGELLDVQRQNSQVFLRSPNSGAFIPGARPNAGWATGLGTGLGWNGAIGSATGIRYGGFWEGSNSLTTWIAMVPAGDGQYRWGGLVTGGGATPIDTWIQQLELI